MHALFDSIVTFLIALISKIGYAGIFLGMFIESTIIPVPSELVMIPAGIAASKGEMDLILVTISGIAGNVLGALFSYYLAASLGRGILIRFGRYFFVKAESIIIVEEFFRKHGPISVFVSRLLPGFRHFISLPAGVAKMPLRTFFFYTLAGSAIWTTVLTLIGFYIGKNQEIIGDNILRITSYSVIAICVAVLATYLVNSRYKRNK